MIIIDGPDGAGKSTLGEMLVNHGIVTECWLSPKKVHPNKPLIESTREYINQAKYNHKVAIDRLVFSELVYGPIMRGKCEFTPLETVDMISSLIDSGSIFIFCLPNASIFKSDEDPKVMAMIRLIYAEYGNWAIALRSISRQPTRVIRYQWNLPQAFEVLCSTLRRFQ